MKWLFGKRSSIPSPVEVVAGVLVEQEGRDAMIVQEFHSDEWADYIEAAEEIVAELRIARVLR